MADCGLRNFISYLFSLVLAENGTAINAIYAQISKTLAVMLADDPTKETNKK